MVSMKRKREATRQKCLRQMIGAIIPAYSLAVKFITMFEARLMGKYEATQNNFC
jgi:hypothetical protein